MVPQEQKTGGDASDARRAPDICRNWYNGGLTLVAMAVLAGTVYWNGTLKRENIHLKSRIAQADNERLAQRQQRIMAAHHLDRS